LERDAYDAWGKRRNWSDWSDDTTCALTSSTTRGFTGHEELDTLCLINANARLYDATVGRFLSADPTTEAIYDLQDLNRYSYVGNNPLSLTDPTGLCFLGCFWHTPEFRAALGLAVAILLEQPWALASLEGTAFAGTGLGGVINAGIAGGASGAISSGKLRGTLIGAAEGMAFFEVGSGLKSLGNTTMLGSHTIDTFVAHGVVGGLASVAGGGKFGSGFLAAGIGSLADNPALDMGDDWAGRYIGNTVVHAVAGGIGSMLGGGKFLNGADTGAFGYLFNSALHPGIGHNGGPPLDNEDVDPPDWFWNVLRPTPVGVFICGLFCGGAVEQYEGVVTPEGIAKIEQHLARLDALDYGPNQAMLRRLQGGGETAQDLAFYQHELYEARLMDKGMDAEEAHLATLKWQGIPFTPGFQARLFDPDVMQKFPDAFNAAARRANGLP
jgi:RHS repeat-associated protein